MSTELPVDVLKIILTMISACALPLFMCNKVAKSESQASASDKKEDASASASKASTSKLDSPSDASRGSSDQQSSASKLSKVKSERETKKKEQDEDKLVLSVVKPPPIDLSQVPPEIIEKLNKARTQEEKADDESSKLPNWLDLKKTQSVSISLKPKAASKSQVGRVKPNLSQKKSIMKPPSTPTAKSSLPKKPSPKYRPKAAIVTFVAGAKGPTVAPPEQAPAQASPEAQKPPATKPPAQSVLQPKPVLTATKGVSIGQQSGAPPKTVVVAPQAGAKATLPTSVRRPVVVATKPPPAAPAAAPVSTVPKPPAQTTPGKPPSAQPPTQTTPGKPPPPKPSAEKISQSQPLLI
ncbi:hypothetical protein Q1695_009373 [Nippostrongylus brasiliensis]|nr:hypothetical protein Q1695_009373 [Nippostrongylus brasiliensis]